MKVVAVVDYGLCNLDSVARAVEECGGSPCVTSEPARIREASHIVLPGVGAFADAMGELRRLGLDEVLPEVVTRSGVPFLGICLGMQLMASVGFEGGKTPGLDLVAGEVRRLVPDAPGVRIPHVGWNEITATRDSPLFRGIVPSKDFYFVHSYHFVCRDEQNVLARTDYCGGFTSAVSSGQNLFGVQFHPEKSQKVGFQLLRNFLESRPTC